MHIWYVRTGTYNTVELLIDYTRTIAHIFVSMQFLRTPCYQLAQFGYFVYTHKAKQKWMNATCSDGGGDDNRANAVKVALWSGNINASSSSSAATSQCNAGNFTQLTHSLSTHIVFLLHIAQLFAFVYVDEVNVCKQVATFSHIIFICCVVMRCHHHHHHHHRFHRTLSSLHIL